MATLTLTERTRLMLDAAGVSAAGATKALADQRSSKAPQEPARSEQDRATLRALGYAGFSDEAAARVLREHRAKNLVRVAEELRAAGVDQYRAARIARSTANR